MLWPQPGLHESRPCNKETAVMRLKFKKLVSSSLIAAITTASGFTILPTGVALAAGDVPLGTATGLPVPRYVSLRAGQVNLRQGPSKEHGTLWIYRREGLPVEITAEFETWRKIRDSDGTEGWVLHSLLSGRRTAIVAPWNKNGAVEIRERPNTEAAVAARLEPRVVGQVRKCDHTWCRISGKGFDGFIPQKELWGVYPNERLD
jgi:SH3-like domain-containing protein